MSVSTQVTCSNLFGAVWCHRFFSDLNVGEEGFAAAQKEKSVNSCRINPSSYKPSSGTVTHERAYDLLTQPIYAGMIEQKA